LNAQKIVKTRVSLSEIVKVGAKFSALLENQKNLEKTVVPHGHFPQSVMVWAGITATGKTPLVFVERGVKINAAVYQEQILNKVVKPWARRHFENQPWTLQQDWAPAHSAKTTLAFCKKEFPDMWDRDLWPSNSPDLNPMDFSVWGLLERNACATHHKSIEALKAALKKAWAKITPDLLTRIVANFRKRLKACIAAKGDHFEHLLK
jgi:hypothetical protein